MSAAEIRVHLCDLQLERLDAESSGLTDNLIYMADLVCERAEYQQALAAAINDALTLRSELSRRQYG